MIYIHIPFCHRKCSYCAFYSKPVGTTDPSRYVDALCRELEMRSFCMEHPVRTVYFGGGTPSLLPVRQLAHIIETLQRCYDLSALEECTLEANPEDLTREYLVELRALKFFNRISIGVQSFDDGILRLLNRRHTGDQAFEAVENTFGAGFANIGVDLIYGIPGQSAVSWYMELGRLRELPVSHLSAYTLTVEPHTILEVQMGNGKLPEVDEKVVMIQYEIVQRWAKDRGFEQYEVSNFALPGCRSLHNSRYWNHTPYLGVGASAHSFDGEFRRWNVADIEQYCTLLDTGRVPHDEEQLTVRDVYNEYLMTALRTTEGIDKNLVPPPFARTLDTAIRRFVDTGLVEDTGTHYRPTKKGLLQADGIARDLFE